MILSKLIISLFSTLIIISTITLMISSIAFSLQTIDNQYSFAFKWGSRGTGDGQFLRPHDVEFDSNGNVYVSDRDRNDIQKFTPNGTFLMKWGSEGNNAGQFNVPYSIEVDPFDNIYVVDRGNEGNQRMQVFSQC